MVTNYYEKVYTPKDMGLDYISPEEIFGGASITDASAIFDSVLNGTSTTAQKNVIIANAACGIGIMDRNMSIEDSVAMARESLESGRALQAFRKFVEINQ